MQAKRQPLTGCAPSSLSPSNEPGGPCFDTNQSPCGLAGIEASLCSTSQDQGGQEEKRTPMGNLARKGETTMNARLLTAPWVDLCEEERELIVEMLTEAGRAAACRSTDREQGSCFQAYEQLIAEAQGDRPPERWRTLTREDLRSAAFCVAFEDERRRLLGLCPVPQRLTWLAQSVTRAERLYRAAMVLYESMLLASECLQEERLRHGLVPAPTPPGISREWRRSADLLTLALMRFNLATGGHGDEIRHVLR
jgi:hypothetical protein